MNTRAFLITTGIAGLAMGLLSSLPVISVANCCLCLWIWTGGILAVYLYRYFAKPSGPVTITQGLLLGLASAVLAAFISAAVSAILGPISFEAMRQVMETVEGYQESIGPFLDTVGVSGFSWASLFIDLFFYAIFGMVGGVLGTLIFKGKSTTQPAPLE